MTFQRLTFSNHLPKVPFVLTNDLKPAGLEKPYRLICVIPIISIDIVIAELWRLWKALEKSKAKGEIYGASAY